MKNNIKNYITIFMYFFFDVFFVTILSLFKIDYGNLTNVGKNIYLIGDGIGFMLVVFILYKDELKNDFNNYKYNYKKYFSKYINVYIFGVILMGVSNSIISKFTNMEISNNETTIRNIMKTMPIYISFSTVIYAPFIEEMVFRKSFKNIIKNKTLFIVISGLTFGLMHVITGDETINDILMGIPYVLVGFVFAYIYAETDNIFSTIQFHFLHNLILLIVQFL